MGCVQIHMKTAFKGRVEEEEQPRTLGRKGDFRKREHDSEGAGMTGRGWETVKMKNSDWTRQFRGHSHFRELCWGLDRA